MLSIKCEFISKSLYSTFKSSQVACGGLLETEANCNTQVMSLVWVDDLCSGKLNLFPSPCIQHLRVHKLHVLGYWKLRLMVKHKS